VASGKIEALELDRRQDSDTDSTGGRLEAALELDRRLVASHHIINQFIISSSSTTLSGL